MPPRNKYFKSNNSSSWKPFKYMKLDIPIYFFLISASLLWKITPSVFLSDLTLYIWLRGLPPPAAAWVQGLAKLLRLHHHSHYSTDLIEVGDSASQHHPSSFARTIWKLASHCTEGRSESGADGGLIFHHMECACLEWRKKKIHKKAEQKGEEGGREVGGDGRKGVRKHMMAAVCLCWISV